MISVGGGSEITEGEGSGGSVAASISLDEELEMGAVLIGAMVNWEVGFGSVCVGEGTFEAIATNPIRIPTTSGPPERPLGDGADGESAVIWNALMVILELCVGSGSGML